MATLPFPPTAIATAESAPTLVYAAGATLYAFDPAPSGSASPAVEGDKEGARAKAQVSGLVRKLAVSADGKLAVTAGDDKTLRVWDLGGPDGPQLRSTRSTLKRVACVTFTPANDLIVTDKVGDVFLYPLNPRDVASGTERAQGFKEQADPSLNPDADFLLGHVSIVSQHVLAPGGKRLITADRDEHIRVSRFPMSYVIDKYLWGSEGFVSAIHVPPSTPDVLVSGGGEPTLQVFNWTTGALLRRIEVMPAVLPYRRVRPSARKIKGRRRAEMVAAAASGPAPSDDPTDPGFFAAPQGMQYPTGQNVCVAQIDSAPVADDATAVIFFSMGCTALQSFLLTTDPEAEVQVHSMPLLHPVLGLSRVPRSQTAFVVTLDAAYGAAADAELSPRQYFSVVEAGADGRLTDASASHEDLLASLAAPLASDAARAPASTVSGLSAHTLYAELGLFPRWPGFEEDEELAGPAAGESTPGTGTDASGAATPVSASASAPEFDGLAPKQLGRLKAQGIDVSHLLPSKKRRKAAAAAKDKSNGKDEAEAESAGSVSGPGAAA